MCDAAFAVPHQVKWGSTVKNISRINNLISVTIAVLLIGVAGTMVAVNSSLTRASAESATAAPAAIPASVAIVDTRAAALTEEFSGRLEAVNRVDVRSRVSGAIQEIHFREGALVKRGDLLVKIDPALYAAELARAEGQVAAATARLTLAKADFERGQQLTDSRAISQRDFDTRINGYQEAAANLKAAQAVLQTARLNLDYTDVRAPVAGRVGKIEYTVGNLIDAGPSAPVLTTLVSVSPIYASFNADEEVVTRALKALTDESASTEVDRIPVHMSTNTSSTPFKGKMQFIDNQIDARSGTVRVRAVFDNDNGLLMPGQFARLSMGQPRAEQALLISERAVGTDQNKKFVMVLDEGNKADYREVSLGGSVNGLRIVTSGLKAGERIVVNGLQRVKPGALIKPEMVNMDFASARTRTADAQN